MILKGIKKQNKGFPRIVDFGFVFENVSKNLRSLVAKFMSCSVLKSQKSKTFSKPKFTTGFTLVESLVAISILMVAIVAPMSIAQKGLSSAMYSKDQMTASFLAQDAVEFIKNKRDEVGVTTFPEYPPTVNWLKGLESCTSNNGTNVCYIDTTKEILSSAITNTRAPLYAVRNTSDSTFLYYGFENNSLGKSSQISKFTREVRITDPANGDNNEALVDVKVSWANAGITETVEIKNFIYNYWENL